jgi:hypothetical protein
VRQRSPALSRRRSLIREPTFPARRTRPVDRQHCASRPKGRRCLRSLLRLPQSGSSALGQVGHDQAPFAEEAGRPAFSRLPLLSPLTESDRRSAVLGAQGQCGCRHDASRVLCGERWRSTCSSIATSAGYNRPHSCLLPTSGWHPLRGRRSQALGRHQFCGRHGSRLVTFRLPLIRPSLTSIRIPAVIICGAWRPSPLSLPGSHTYYLAGIPYPNAGSTELKERMSYLKSMTPVTGRPSGALDAGQVLCAVLSVAPSFVRELSPVHSPRQTKTSPSAPSTNRSVRFLPLVVLL